MEYTVRIAGTPCETRVSGGTTTALPADILSSVKGFGLGSYASKVKFTNITWTAE